MPKRLCIIQGHPDPMKVHFCHALANAYVEGAREGGHEIREIFVADLDFPILRSKEEWENTPTPPALRQPQQDVLWADHMLIVYPLWLGGLPALLKGFLEQLFRPDLVQEKSELGKMFANLLKGKTSRIVVTMGMPGVIFRWYYGAHSLNNLKRSILGFCGMGPIKDDLVGIVESMSEAKRKQWLERMKKLGRQGV